MFHSSSHALCTSAGEMRTPCRTALCSRVSDSFFPAVPRFKITLHLGIDLIELVDHKTQDHAETENSGQPVQIRQRVAPRPGDGTVLSRPLQRRAAGYELAKPSGARRCEGCAALLGGHGRGRLSAGRHQSDRQARRLSRRRGQRKRLCRLSPLRRQQSAAAISPARRTSTVCTPALLRNRALPS